jgi:2-polyprenyl-3-methyl-5-hydroxy-6-metoxy-1,4-benzoquinol methylase
MITATSRKVAPSESALPRNPHFDDERIVWSDNYSGQYAPVEYDQQFDRQWKLFLEHKTGFHEHSGVETNDEYIDDRIEDITGLKDFLLRKRFGIFTPAATVLTGRLWREKQRAIGGRLNLDPRFPVTFFQGKRCLDIGCGAGRWTRTLLSLGGTVKAVDVSEHGLRSTRRFNNDVEYLNLFGIIPSRADLHEAFDFTLCWGVIMCTHDPRLAFENVSRTVKPGGSLYLMVYKPSYHASEFVVNARRYYHRVLPTQECRHNFVLELTAEEPRNAHNYHDMLNTFYNWVIEENTIREWCKDFGFDNPRLLNAAEKDACAHHILVSKKY